MRRDRRSELNRCTPTGNLATWRLDTVEAFVEPCKSRYPLTTPTGGTPQPIDHSYPRCCSHPTSARRSIHKRSSHNHYPVSRSWTQAEFLLSGRSMPRTPDGAPLEWHASFLPLDDKFTIGTDEPHSKPCRGCVPPPPSPSKPPPGTSLRGLTASSEWHAFGGDEVPLVRQHSQGARQQTRPAPLPSRQ